MKLDISQLLLNDNASVDFEYEHKLETLIDDAEFSDVSFKGRVMREGRGLRLEGVISTSYNTLCSRCAKEIKRKVEIAVDERIVSNLVDNDGELFVFHGRELNLEDIVGEILIINTPMKHLCSTECQGLCSRCGCTAELCKCKSKDGEYRDNDSNNEEVTDNNRFGVLKNLLNRD